MMNIKDYLRSNPRVQRIAASLYSAFGHNTTTVRGRGNQVAVKGTFRRRCRIRIYGDNNQVVFAESSHSVRNVSVSIYGSNNRLLIGKDFASDGLAFSIEDDNNRIVLGECCHGGRNSELAAIEGTEIFLGDGCMLSANITIRTGDSHSVLDAASGERVNKSKSVFIGQHVWIGNTVLIFKGARIGSHSIVAGGSIVTGKTFPENCIIGGNPAKVIKEGVDWRSERI